MNVAAITVAVEWDPHEIQEWFDKNPSAVICQILSHDNLIYIFYE